MRFIFVFMLALSACGTQTIERGEKGLTGSSGATGPTGATGKDGSLSSIAASSISCDGGLENTGLHFTYSAAVFKGGDVFATGAIYGNAFEIGASNFYAASQNGATTAPVLFTYDIIDPANGGWWQVSVNRATSVTSIKYTDTDAVNGAVLWTMAPQNCTINNYN